MQCLRLPPYGASALQCCVLYCVVLCLVLPQCLVSGSVLETVCASMWWLLHWAMGNGQWVAINNWNAINVVEPERELVIIIILTSIIIIKRNGTVQLACQSD